MPKSTNMQSASVCTMEAEEHLQNLCPGVQRGISSLYGIFCTCTVALFLNQQFLKMASISTFLLGNLPKDQELEKVIWPNIALSMRTGPHTLYNVDYKGRSSKNRFLC